jgi:ATP-dependent Lhr-like helicase
MRKHLSSVQWAVVDEVHELAESKRGVQLTVALERLYEAAGNEFQRIGLSATVGNPDEVAKFVAGVGRPIKIVQVALPKGYSYRVETPNPTDEDYDLASKLNTSPEAAARISRILRLVDSHKSTLIFVNSRENAEVLGHKFTQLGRADIAVHHGSLSREERAQIEDEFKTGVLKAIVCTSTLELGIDVGQVDLVVQYLSPRQVGSLIQRVGRSGHRLDMLSQGVIITAYPDDTLESIAAVKNAYQGRIEPVLIHEEALDVLAHQIVGIIMDKGSADAEELLRLFRRTYPYRNLSKEKLLDVIFFLDRLNELRAEQNGEIVRKARRTRPYYYENLSMIPDEKRYPMINVVSDRKIGTLGDEFMALRARIGLNFIVRGRVWRIVQIEEDTGTVYVVPSEDPLAAAPGWDGEILPVPFELANKTGEMRDEIRKALTEAESPEAAAEHLAEEFDADKTSILEAVKEVAEHIKQGAPIPTSKHILLELFDKYLIVHASFGEMVNRALGGVFDALLSEREVITSWWNDGYRILIETPRKLNENDLKQLPNALFHLTNEQVDKAFGEYLESKFPFSYKMKFVADRFGALQRGKTMSYERLSQLPNRFKDTPIYDETLREAMLEKVDIKRVKQIMRDVSEGNLKVSTLYRSEKPTPLALHILAKYSDLTELMAPEEMLTNNLDKMKKAIETQTVRLLCMSCMNWAVEEKVRDLPDQPQCERCGSKLLANLYRSQDPEAILGLLKKRMAGKELTEEELKTLTHARRTADLILSYGKEAVIALKVKGVGPETASRILGKMHQTEEEFFTDLLKAKINYIKHKPFWDRKKRREQNA